MSALLDTQIQSFCQELQDHILHFTLLATLPRKKKLSTTETTPESYTYTSRLIYKPVYGKKYPAITFQPTSQSDPHGVLLIEDTYKPPTALQINKKLRAEFAELMYRDLIVCWWCKLNPRWLKSICDEHYAILDPSKEALQMPWSILTRLDERMVMGEGGAFVRVKVEVSEKEMKARFDSR